MKTGLKNDREFDLDLYERNFELFSKGYIPKSVKKTGTTIVGIVYRDGVVLGADTRATSGSIVADKNISKIHPLTDSIYCCGAGTAADTQFITETVGSSLSLYESNMQRKPKVDMAVRLFKQRLFRYQGNIGAALIVGGTDPAGTHLYSIHPSGAVIKSPYLTMGSGSLAAISILETYYKKDLDEKSAISLVKKAVQSGIINDMGSGSNVDIVVISKETKVLRNYRKLLDTEKKSKIYVPQKGVTIVTKETIHQIEKDTSTIEQHIPMVIDA